jgi:hypothetical protein
MPDPLISAAHYRTKAAECHQLAGLTSDPNLRAQFIEMAQLYGQLAADQENLAASMKNGCRQAGSLQHDFHPSPGQSPKRTTR